MENQEETLVYKVLSKDRYDKTLHSSFAPIPLALEYKVGITTIPEIGYLFAFETKETAIAFAKACCLEEVWSATAIIDSAATQKIRETSVIGSKFILCDNALINKFWETFIVTEQDLKYYSCLGPTPSGTLLCTQITLKESVSI